ncbi:hypothetical protein AB4369_20780 [Vibrio sp. 10N.261.49.A5]|uniref:HEPN AbiU2-like domain-containing protein n=1 Tax=Vibrio tasmaniensis 1F-267 TaxID=1191324 RepID=A0ABX3B8C2_9VIBR|nr:hypothetical protein [Vibrio tasmaniensis]OEF46710.1 hypothetical protein A163_07950 [Vibrio tasmaniensis 1F-267]
MYDEQYEAEKILNDQYLEELDDEVWQMESLWLYLDKRDEFSKQYSTDLVKEYYLDHPHLANNVRNTVRAMMQVQDVEPLSSLIMAMTSLEVLTKNVLLRPFMTGMLHNGFLAELITKQVLSQNGLDRFNNLLYWIIDEHLADREGSDSSDIKFISGRKTIWQTRSELQKIRNEVIHKANSCSAQDAQNAYDLFKQFDSLTTRLLGSLGLGYSMDFDKDIITVTAKKQSSFQPSFTILESLSLKSSSAQQYNEPPMDFDDEIPGW